MKKKSHFLTRHPILVFLVVVSVFYCYFYWQTTQEKLDAYLLTQEHLKEEIETLEGEIERLNDVYAYSQTEESIERIAREKLKMVKPNEIIYWIRGLNDKGGHPE